MIYTVSITKRVFLNEFGEEDDNGEPQLVHYSQTTFDDKDVATRYAKLLSETTSARDGTFVEVQKKALNDAETAIESLRTLNSVPDPCKIVWRE